MMGEKAVRASFPGCSAEANGSGGGNSGHVSRAASLDVKANTHQGGDEVLHCPPGKERSIMFILPGGLSCLLPWGYFAFILSIEY